MRILITGGGGFIGAWIVKRLAARGDTLRIFDLREDRTIIEQVCGKDVAGALEWVVGDIANTGRVNEAAVGCDALIHLAGLLTPACRADPVLGAHVNLIGSLNIFLAARSHRIDKVVYMSSAGVFGPDGEDAPCPTTHYGAFKLAVERCAVAFWADDQISSIGFRPFVVYGPGREGGLSAGPSLACKAAASAQPYVIPFTGTFDIVHVDDVAAAFERALDTEQPGAHIVNLLGGTARERDVVDAVLRVAPSAAISAEGPPMPIKLPMRDKGMERLLPGWSPRSLDEGIAQTIAFYRQMNARARKLGQ